MKFAVIANGVKQSSTEHVEHTIWIASSHALLAMTAEFTRRREGGEDENEAVPRAFREPTIFFVNPASPTPPAASLEMILFRESAP
ncbi:MAG TPA: hypothetical protein VIT45_06670 [Allosphingosinicella sp.]